MIGSVAGGAPHPLHDGPAAAAAAGWPFSKCPSTVTLPRRRVGVGVTAIPQQSTAGVVTAAVVEQRNSLSNLHGTTTTTTAAAKSRRILFLDVNPICYDGAKPSLHSFAHWLSLFLSQVSLRHPVIAVLDGERGNDYRRQLLPSYKAHRRKFVGQMPTPHRLLRGSDCPGPNYTERHVSDVLRQCNVPVVKIHGYEADDVVATLADQVLQKGFHVVIGSPDKDFKQLISEDVQIVMPMSEIGRWSFYTLRHYIAQYNCDPSSDLSLRCIVGDEVDGVPGIQHLAPGFGRKTALKLLKKHGSLENLLNTAAIRTVGKHYAQDALTNYADYLRKNYEVLRLRRDADIHLQEAWLSERDTCNDSAVLSNFVKKLSEAQKMNERNSFQ